ncbi:MAG: phosphotransferase [Chloroflexi bacterium]|nr:phosphotransferase [Chloroflexota bacterium]
MGRRYAVTTAAGMFFLKVRSEWWPVEQAEQVCALVKHLHLQEFPVAAYRLTVEGKPFALWEGHICECHEFIDGQPLSTENLDHNSAAGHALSRFHSLTSTHSPPCGQLPEGCGYPWPGHVQFFYDRVRSIFADQEEPLVTLGRVMDALTALDPEAIGTSHPDEIAGHGDYHPGNLIFHDGEVAAVCDFDFFQRAPRAYDIAYFLYRTAGVSSRSGGGPVHLERGVTRAFLTGYESDAPNSSPSVPRDAIAPELLRFAWYNCLLTANNTQEPEKFEEWAVDTVVLEGDVELWVAEADEA